MNIFSTVQGIYCDGIVQLDAVPDHVRDNTLVIVTFLTAGGINLSERGIDQSRVADLRSRLATFAEEWDNPEMNISDNYDAAKNNL